MNSRAKGKRGELEAALLLRQLGIPAKRSAQHSGALGLADLDTQDGVLWEVKLRERLEPYAFMAQAIRDASRSNRVPAVLMRSNRREWLIVIEASRLPEFARLMHGAIQASTGTRAPVEESSSPERSSVDEPEE